MSGDEFDGGNAESHKGALMRLLKKRSHRDAGHGSPKIRMQPNYHSEISESYIDAMQKTVDANKPSNFRLTPVTEPGW